MPTVALEAPKTNTLAAFPTINTDTFFDGTNYGNCAAINAMVAAGGAPQTLKLQNVIDNVSTFKSAVDSVLDPGSSVSEATRGYPAINTYLTKLENESLLYYRLARDCIRESSGAASATAAYTKQSERTEESKARLESITDPERATSYYEGWFPLFRPMTETALFVLFGTGILLLALSIFIFLNTRGVSVAITLPEGGLGLPLPDFSGSGPYIGGGLALGAVAGYLIFKYVIKV